MHRIDLALVFLLCGFFTDSAVADPYRWCGVFGSGDASVTNCYFMTIDQCRASMSGNGGFCTPNNFYDGRPVIAPGDAITHAKKRNSP